MSLPLVSIIIPTYNYGHYITEAIGSIQDQNYPFNNIEIIVVDDGSTDNTREVLRKYIDRGIIHYYYQPNKGKANATNYAIQKASGKYIFNLDADDYYFPDKIASTVRIYEENPGVVHVGSPAKAISAETNVSQVEDVPADILEKLLDGKWLMMRFYNSNILFGGGSTYSARASVLKKIVIPNDVDMYIDEFLILAVLPFGQSYFIKQPLSVWRVHKTNYTTRTNEKQEQTRKEERLIHSSGAVLAYLETHDFENRLVKIYRLRDATRKIVFKEFLDTKSVKDILNYTIRVFFIIRPSLKLVMKYNVIVRLFPSPLIRFLKRLRKIKNTIPAYTQGKLSENSFYQRKKLQAKNDYSKMS